MASNSQHSGLSPVLDVPPAPHLRICPSFLFPYDPNLFLSEPENALFIAHLFIVSSSGIGELK
jgi:hypothetical protein